MTPYFYEFLYRGRPTGSAEPPAWHVVLRAEGTDAFGAAVSSEKTLNMAQAAEVGFDLPTSISAINADILIENETLRGIVADAAMREDELRAEIERLEAAGAPAPLPG